ncbi:hypothetical protein [Pseudomonas nitroreducens]|uniref:hypothetical protein n=1 Tax=Pseudomonas nitroreducens TaxID=46680 RepID=UPI001FB60A0C|nr:hypothetical protein [Pseudomonas nitroreducens]MCJ1882551.1 hypothetical protein [Pseudomonas nitroreducens]MCJ1894967.1 hypothetical protein [Pseudomonas nitroreducens]
MSRLKSIPAVPPTYLGVWQRTLLTTTGGTHDTRTRVYWLQTGRLFADLRIPLPAPQSPGELSAQAGFAGITEITGDICQWHRAIDFQPPNGGEDIGRMHFVNSEKVLEDGLDGSYHEVWERLPESIGRNRGVWLSAADGRQGCLLLAGDCFLFAAGRREALPMADSLAALRDSDHPELLDFELSFGRHYGGETPWKIELSTLPARIGADLLPATADPDHPELLGDASWLNGLGVTPPAGGWQPCELPLFPEEVTP